jgi:hypothetical protein
MGISREDLKPPANAIFLRWFLWRSGRRGLNAEYPVVVPVDGMSEQLRLLAVQVAADIPDDAAAVTAIRAAGGKSKNWKIAAASMRADGYTREHRIHLRAARLLAAAADDGLPVPPSSEEEALFKVVESLEALSLDDAFAVLAVEVPALRALEQQVVCSLSAPTGQDAVADERVLEILRSAALLVGPKRPDGSPLVRSHAARDRASVYLLGKAGLLR